jgi:cytochrome c5
MKPVIVAASALGALVALTGAASAYDGDWKRGRVYYRMVCTACHTEQAGGAIAPSAKTKAEWTAYIQADKHAKGKDTVKQYVSKQYRDSIKAKNKAAEKYADVPEAELLADIKAFVLYGAKDSDNPARCN